MASQAHEFKAKTVDEAIEEGLATLKVQREAVDVEVVTRGSRGIFGIGSEPAVVRLTLRAQTPPPPVAPPPVAPSPVKPVVTPAETVKAPPPPATPVVAAPAAQQAAQQAAEVTPAPRKATNEGEQASAAPADEVSHASVDDEERANDATMAAMAVELLDRMIYLMGFEATVTATWQEEDDDDFEDDDSAEDEGDTVRSRRYLHLDVEGADLGALIGRRGETLENIQYLLRLMVNQKLHRWKNIIVDIEHYKARRVTQLTQLAQRMAEQVARSGRAVSLEPMPANERRIVHMALRGHPDVYTESYGDGSRRKVHIFAKN